MGNFPEGENKKAQLKESGHYWENVTLDVGLFKRSNRGKDIERKFRY